MRRRSALCSVTTSQRPVSESGSDIEICMERDLLSLMHSLLFETDFFASSASYRLDRTELARLQASINLSYITSSAYR